MRRKKAEDKLKREKTAKRFQSLEETLKSMQGLDTYGGFEYSDFFLFPEVDYPPKFKIPDFAKYNGTGEPYAHLQVFAGELGAYGKDDKLRMHLFQRSLTGPALNWLIRLDRSKIHQWSDLAKALWHSIGTMQRWSLIGTSL